MNIKKSPGNHNSVQLLSCEMADSSAGQKRLDHVCTNVQSCIKFIKFRSRSVHHNDLREKIKIKFTGISDLDLSFQLTMI